MAATDTTGARRQESTEGQPPHVTARTRATENEGVKTAYRVDGRTYLDVDRVEAILRGEEPWD